jgi:hypothetical protein
MRILLAGALAAAVMALTTPSAQAQYHFDFRVDPQNCHWQDICDYGGRAIRARRVYRHRGVILRRLGDVRPAAVKAYAYAPGYAPCRVATVRREHADGTVMMKRVRSCG